MFYLYLYALNLFQMPFFFYIYHLFSSNIENLSYKNICIHEIIIEIEKQYINILLMQPPKEQQVKVVEEQDDEEYEEYEEEITGKNKTALNERLINCVKKGEYEEVQRCIKRKADLNYQQNNKKRWTAFIWACCQGHDKIVRLMISRGASQQYLEVNPEFRNVIMGATKQMRPNPLHWACFKGHLLIVQLLIKAGVHWQDIDSCGNNSVMLAAAGNFPQIFKKFLQLGVLLDCKNSRGHSVKDLTTHPQILSLVTASEKSVECPISKTAFKEKQVKNWCWVCNRFVSCKNFKVQWFLKDLESQQKEQLDGRCSICWNSAKNMQKQLQQAMESKDEARLKKTKNLYLQKEAELDVKFLENCDKLVHKLEVQNKILGCVSQLGKVDNYKTILKSINHIQSILKDAQPLGISHQVVDTAEKAIQRLNAQRNLRFQIDNIDTSVATREGITKLQNIYSDAETKSVSSQYLSVAGQIKDKMARSIKVQDLYQLFLDYPQRPDPYPEPLAIDFKTKKPLDPQTKKPTDPVNLLPKKKGKKQHKFVIPEWATQLKDLNDKIRQEEQLLHLREQLGLSPQFCKKVEEIITLIKRQSRYRKDVDRLQAMIDQASKKKK